MFEALESLRGAFLHYMVPQYMEEATPEILDSTTQFRHQELEHVDKITEKLLDNIQKKFTIWSYRFQIEDFADNRIPLVRIGEALHEGFSLSISKGASSRLKQSLKLLSDNGCFPVHGLKHVTSPMCRTNNPKNNPSILLNRFKKIFENEIKFKTI